MTPDKDQKIAELQEHAKAPTEHSHFESKTTVDVEDRIAALSDFIKFRSLETLMKRLQGRRLGSSLNSISLFPYFQREIAIKRRGPQIKPSEAHFLFLLARLTRTASLHQKLRGLSSIRRRAQASNDLQLREETLRSRSKLRASRVRQLCFIFAQNKEKNLRAAIGRLKLESLQSSFDDHVKVHRWVHGVSLVKSLLAQDRKSRMLQAFICMKNGLISSLKKEVIEITRSIHDQKVYSDKQKQELDNQGTFSLSLKAEINKLKSTQATTQLELQKSQAKVKVLEAENMTLLGRCESLTGTCNQLREEKNHLEQLTDRIRQEYLNLQQDYEEKIENFNQATEDVSKAAAKSSMERAGLADKIKALIEQREEDKVALYKAGRCSLMRTGKQRISPKEQQPRTDEQGGALTERRA